MVTLGCGVDLPGMTDLDLVDQLYHYINGGIKATSNSVSKFVNRSKCLSTRVFRANVIYSVM